MHQTWIVPALGATVFTTIPLYARLVRGRTYATFGLVILAISLPGLIVAHQRLRELAPPPLQIALDAAFAYGIAAAGAHLAGLVRPRLRTPAFRRAVSIPGMATIAAGALAGVWLLALLPLRAAAGALGHERLVAGLAWLDLVPFLLAGLSVATSLRAVEEVVRVPLARHGPDAIARVPVERRRVRLGAAAPIATDECALRIVQVADPHLGPWLSVDRLRTRLERLLDHDPDLVCLTGDFLTMESAATPGALGRALEPLRRAPGRCFAVFGNHDHEAPDEVRAALVQNGVTLLMDTEVAIATRVGPVQILGADYVGRGRRHRLEKLFARHPRREDHLRLLLLHDPSTFKHVPPGEVDLTLSGHTHGGQVGLVSLGFDWTVLRRTGFPDHGLFAHGANRLYVHRGTGFYGFPLRIGVPGEASLLDLIPAAARE